MSRYHYRATDEEAGQAIQGAVNAVRGAERRWRRSITAPSKPEQWRSARRAEAAAQVALSRQIGKYANRFDGITYTLARIAETAVLQVAISREGEYVSTVFRGLSTLNTELGDRAYDALVGA